MVSNDTAGVLFLSKIIERIESRIEVQAYLQDLMYALDNGARLKFQEERIVDQNRDIHYTNKYTVADLFPDDDPRDVLKKELRKITVKDYIRTVKDTRFKNKSEMREFGKVYCINKDVYIKLRVELLKDFGNHYIFVMSFHYAEKPFTSDMFPYKN